MHLHITTICISQLALNNWLIMHAYSLNDRKYKTYIILLLVLYYYNLFTQSDAMATINLISLPKFGQRLFKTAFIGCQRGNL